MDKGTHTHVAETLVFAPAELVHKTFLSRVWWGGGFPSYMPLPASGVAQKPKNEAGVGAIRQVPGFILEEILDAKMGEFIEYTLKRKMFMPVSYHRGRVSFFPAGPGCTRVVWTVSYTPFPVVGNTGVKLFCSTFDLFFLPALKQEAEKQAKYVPVATPHSGLTWTFAKLLLLAYVAFMVSRAVRIPGMVPQEPGPAYVAECNKFRAESSELSAALKDDVFLIIGGTGFTGSAIVDDLRNRGIKGIRVMGRKVPASPQYPYPNGGKYPIQGVEYIKGDVLDKDALLKAMTGATVVIHTAVSYGSPSFSSLRGLEATERVNVGGMKNIYEAAVAAKTVKQILYTSSCDTIFSGRNLWRANETHPYLSIGSESTHAENEMAVGDTYAKTKIQAEKYILSMDGKNGIRTASLRPNGIFGPGEFSAFKKAIDPAFVLGFFPIYFDEKQETDWTCVYNLVYAHVLASYKLKTAPEVVGGKAYFITDDEITNNAATVIFKPAIEAAAGPVLLWIRIPPWVMPMAGHALEVVEHFVFEKFGYAMPLGLTRKEALKAITSHTHDNSRARADLGYKPLFTTKQCQAHTAEEVARRYGMAK